ncbi:MAG TPA: hypothetical protein DHW47_08645 [Oscillibacter sp.]|nr:hypothetical protein [Oscillibacter sp.]
MNTKKATKRALLTSVMALVMCVVMLVGTTFAWFTDTASTGVNKIQAGNLKVDIVDESGNSLDGKTLNFKDFNGKTDILWEPGATFFTQGFKIANEGNLALKYKVVVSGITGDTGLLKVMKFDVVSAMTKTGSEVNFTATPGQLLPSATGTPSVSDVYYLRGRMAENAGNEYKNMTLTGISVTVYATQLASEFDSIDNKYDENADYSADVWDGTSATAAELTVATDTTAMTVTIDSGKLLAALAQSVNDSKDYSDYTIKLTKNLDLNGNEWTPIGQKNGNKFKGTFDGQGYVVTGLKISEAKADAFDGYVAFFGGTDGATIKNLTVAGSVTGKEAAGIVGKGVNTTLENCHNKATITATESKAAGIVASLDKGTLKNCTNSGAITTKGAWPAAGIVAWCNPNAAIENCQNFGDVTVTGIGDTSQAGGICGNLGSSSVVKNCINSGRISASLAGGVAGRAKGADAQQIQIVNFTNTGSIVASNIAGGVVGDAQNGVTAENCTINGTVSGTKAAGGIFGSTQGNAQSAVTGCTIGATVSSDTANRAGKVVGILGGVVELKLDQSTANDIGCFKGATLTITGITPNNIVFTEITNGFKGDINGFVHENIGHPETIKINGKTYSYLGSNGQQTAYTWTVG